MNTMPWPPHPRGEAPHPEPWFHATCLRRKQHSAAHRPTGALPWSWPRREKLSDGEQKPRGSRRLTGNCVLLQNVGPPLQPQCRHQPTALKHKLWLQAARSPQTGRFPPHCPGWRTAGSTQPHQLRYRHLRPCGHHLAHALCRMAEHRWSDLNWHFHKTQYSKVTQRQSKANPTVHGARCTMNSSSMVLSDSGSKAVLQ